MPPARLPGAQVPGDPDKLHFTDEADAALATLVGRDVDSKGWSIVQPRTGGPGPASVAELHGIRRKLEHAKDSLSELRGRLASALLRRDSSRRAPGC